MKSRKVWIPLIAFFTIMLIVTIVSENIYYDSLPVVVVGNEVELTLNVMDKNDNVVSKAGTLKMSKAQLSPETQSYSFTVEIPDDIRLAMDNGTGVTVNCKYVSDITYDHVVPAGAITFEDDRANRGYIYAVMSRQRAYGKEYYVTPHYVEIQRELGGYVALGNLIAESNSEFTFETTKPLAADMAVRLNKPES